MFPSRLIIAAEYPSRLSFERAVSASDSAAASQPRSLDSEIPVPSPVGFPRLDSTASDLAGYRNDRSGSRVASLFLDQAASCRLPSLLASPEAPSTRGSTGRSQWAASENTKLPVRVGLPRPI